MPEDSLTTFWRDALAQVNPVQPGSKVIAEPSGQHVQRNQPQRIIDAVQGMVQQVYSRNRKGKPGLQDWHVPELVYYDGLYSELSGSPGEVE